MKMKNENGITLISLIVMIIIMLILAVVSLSSGDQSVSESIDYTLDIEASTVQNIVLQRYDRIRATNDHFKHKIKESSTLKQLQENKPAMFIGIAYIPETSGDFKEDLQKIKEYLQEIEGTLEEPETSEESTNDITKTSIDNLSELNIKIDEDKTEYYDQCYYILDRNAQEKLGLEYKGDDYLINYYLGYVCNITSIKSDNTYIQSRGTMDSVDLWENPKSKTTDKTKFDSSLEEESLIKE